MTDNIAVLDGFTKEIYAHNAEYELYLLVKPDTKYDDTFRAWCTDNQEYIRVNGWLFNVEETRGLVAPPYLRREH